MKKIGLLLALTLMIFACENSSKDGKRILSSSSGNINNLTAVVDNALWQGSVGETIRNVLAAPINGLPQDEPLFSIKHMPPVVFTDFATKGRIILKVEKSKNAEAGIQYLENVYAKPQRLVLIQGKTNQEINALIKDNSEKIISVFKTSEIAEKQRRMKKSLGSSEAVEKRFGATIKFPSAYRVAKDTDDFVWIRRDIKTGTVNLMIYEIPLEALPKDDTVISEIIKIRDSVGQAHIPGPTEGSYMITEEAYTPSMYNTIVDNKPAIETRSTWEVKNAFMAGPFINVAVEDKVNNRYLVLEGFVFAPSVEKRNYIFELEAIIRSLKVK